MGLTINNQKGQTAANGTADFVGGVGSNFCSRTWQSENMVYGNLMRENGKVKRIYNEAGYVDIDEAAGTHSYNFYVRDYLGSVRAVVGANGELWQFNDYHVTGIQSSQFGQLNADDHLHTGKEYNAFNGLHMYDNNARTQDPILGRFTTPDPLAEAYPNFSPYAHCRNNPLNKIDINGCWDISVSLSQNRAKNGYGTAVVTNKKGQEVFSFEVRGEGVGGRSRMVKNSDTPFGTYDIPNNMPWIKGGSRTSYGPNERLNMSPESGEIKESGRDGIRIHGGRQEKLNPATGKLEPVENPELKKTQGCLRAYDKDIESLKALTDELQKNDPEEKPGKVIIKPTETKTDPEKDKQK